MDSPPAGSTQRPGRGHGARTPDSAPEPRPPDLLRLDPDFAQEVLGDLYRYRRKRPALAWLFWLVLGWIGAHRFYLERPATGLLMLLTGGGGLIWWVVDGFYVRRLVRAYNEEQATREREGRPPIELDFMPPLADDVLRQPPAWTEKWRTRSRGWRAMRLAGDLLVLMVAGVVLGALAGAVRGGAEAMFAVLSLMAATLLGGAAGWLNRIPLARGLVRWSHRLRLFYYYNRPGTPIGLLLRGGTGPVLALFRRRDRAETRLYVELGAVFTIGFLALDLLEDLVAPLLTRGMGALSPLRLAGLFIQEGFMTLLVTYAFAAPIGAVLCLYLLTRRTHTLARILGAFALFWMLMGAL